MAMNHLTGKAIGQGFKQGLGKLANIGMGTEIIYAFVIIACSLMIYFGTRKLYELSGHKGIKYFRLAFLSFALAYFFRSFIKIIFMNLGITKGMFNSATIMVFIYFSSMAIFYLLYSVIYKKYKDEQIYLFHIFAAAIAIISTFFNNVFIYFLTQLILFAFILFVVLIAKKDSKKKTKGINVYTIYTLLLAFWILNILDTLIPNFFFGTQIFIYLASMTIFFTILYKVLKNTGTN